MPRNPRKPWWKVLTERAKDEAIKSQPEPVVKTGENAQGAVVAIVSSTPEKLVKRSDLDNLYPHGIYR
jgi:hypothetical protein